PVPVAAQGKLQPFAAHRSQLRGQLGGTLPVLRHTFGRENTPAATPCDWLTHLDRPAISLPELLHVAGCQPYQLTQQFVRGDEWGNLRRFGHKAPWLDEEAAGGNSHRLYRLFDFVEVGPRAAGVAAGGRVPGKVNVNTLWDPDVFRAVCDAQPSNYFADAD